ncbi:MAG: hypothetical protein JXR94_20650 [Candidatus Hydrogenedentes bacterium]|nr:hypothetical protein [Candidatus Hydrogenedentota bacterium]
MPKSEIDELRIYCVCGQKMRVSSDMFGRPGKCVACRQKLRIPRPEELEPDTHEVYLKDRPEFLRKTKHRPAEASPLAPQVPEPEVVRDDEEEAPRPSVPLDTLEPLRVIASLEHRIAQELAVRERQGDSAARDDTGKEQLLGYRARLKRARGELEEELHQRLMEVAIELAATQEKIAEAGLAVRVGETDFWAYRTQVTKLRRRRDCLERRQENLRGWIAAHDPFLAGGYVHLGFDHIPEEGFRIAFPPEPDESQLLLDGHVAGLRGGLARREAAERKYAEIQRLADDGQLPPAQLEERQAACRAEGTRAKAEIRFVRERLGQLKADYSSDMHSVDAQLDLLRGRLQVGEIDRERFNGIERDLLRTKADLAKACDVVSRALSANTTQDVPHPRGTFIQRLASAGQAGGAPVDAWIAWGAALMMLVCLVLPAVAGMSPVSALRLLGAGSPGAHWLVTGPVLAALALAGLAFIPRPALRGVSYCCLLTVVWIAWAAFAHETGYSPSTLGQYLRDDGLWMVRPATVMFALSLVAVAVAARFALAAIGRIRLELPVAVLAALVAVIAVRTDLGGLLSPRIGLATRPGNVSEDMAAVAVSNPGRRAVYLSSRMRAANAFDYLLERRVGRGSWRDASVPDELETGGLREPYSEAGLPDLVAIPPGESITFWYRLEAGQYRVTLRSSESEHELTETFSQATSEAAPDSSAEDALDPNGGAGPASAGAAGLDVTAGDRVEMEVSGIATSREREPMFSGSVYLPDGTSRQWQGSIGDEVHAEWRIAEFNPEQQTVTLRRETDLLVLRVGERYTLDR